jgi:hypothetical protein
MPSKGNQNGRKGTNLSPPSPAVKQPHVLIKAEDLAGALLLPGGVGGAFALKTSLPPRCESKAKVAVKR